MYTKLLIPLDGSSLSEKVLPYALRLANQTGAKLLLLRAVEIPAIYSDTPVHEAEALRNAEEYLADVKRVITDPTVKPHIDPDRLETLVVYGKTVKEITELAPFEKADLILMTTHGRSGISRLVLGSIAQQVVRHATVPVMLIRPLDQKHEQALQETLNGIGEPSYDCFETPGGNIVVSLDGSQLSEVGLIPAIELAQKLGATINLLTVVHPNIPVLYGDMVGLGYDAAEISDDSKKHLGDARQYLDKIREKIEAKGVECAEEVQIGMASDGIADFAVSIQAKAVVMVTHARGELGHLFLGSIAEDVVRRSHLPVLLVTPHDHLEPLDTTVAYQKA